MEMALANIGIFAPSPFVKPKILTWRNALISIFMAIFSMMTGAFLLFEAKTLVDYSSSVHAFTTILIITFEISFFSYQSSNIFELIASFKQIIEKRMLQWYGIESFYTDIWCKIRLTGVEQPKSKVIYEEANNEIENWTRIMFTVTRRSAYLLSGSNLAFTLVVYFTTGLEEDDFLNFTYLAW